MGEQGNTVISDIIESLQSNAGIDFSSSFSVDLVSIAVYIFTALALYTIAKRRGIKNPWLAWIPVTQFWIIGSIADNYRKVACGKETKKRKTLLWLQIIAAILAVVLLIAIIAAVISLLAAGYNNYDDPMDLPKVIGSLVGVGAIILLLVGVAIAAAIVQYMALYDIFRSCEPENATLYIVLSIVISVTQAIFLMLCREKDKGMPCAIEAELPQPEEPSENE